MSIELVVTDVQVSVSPTTGDVHVDVSPGTLSGGSSSLYAWLLNLTEGDTAGARAANDIERDAALAACGSGVVSKIIAPPGEYYFDSVMSIDHPVTIEGAGMWFEGGTNFWTPVASRCVEVLYNGAVTAGGRGTLIERMRFGPKSSGIYDDATPGIHIDARCTLREVDVTSAHGHGVEVVASTGDVPPTNANLVRMDNVRADACLGHGFFFDGADSNACLLTLCDAASNALDGFNDSSFLEVTLVGCHAEANGGRSFNLGIDPNASTFAFGCYAEGGQDPVFLGQRAYWIGPYPPDGFDGSITGFYQTPDRSNSFYVEQGGVFARMGRIGTSVAFEHGALVDSKTWQTIYSSGTWQRLFDGTDSIEEWFDDQFSQAEEQRQLYFPAGFSYRKRVLDRTGTRNGTTWDTGKVQSNRGATGDIDYNLPATSGVPVGWFTDLRVAEAHYFRVKAQGSDIIRVGGTVSAAAGFVRSNVVGDCFRVEKQASGEWWVTQYLGTGLTVDA